MCGRIYAFLIGRCDGVQSASTGVHHNTPLAPPRYALQRHPTDSCAHASVVSMCFCGARSEPQPTLCTPHNDNVPNGRHNDRCHYCAFVLQRTCQLFNFCNECGVVSFFIYPSDSSLVSLPLLYCICVTQIL